MHRRCGRRRPLTGTDGREIVAIDGCALRCVEHCLARHGVTPTIHYDLGTYGVEKRSRVDFHPDQADQLFQAVTANLDQRTTSAAMTGIDSGG